MIELPDIVADGRRLEVAEIPAVRPGPTLVLLHEGLGSVSTWGRFAAQVSARLGLRVVAYSRAGYGRSDPVPLPRPLDYMQREALGPLPTLLDALQIDDAVLIGHSDGGTIALVYAASEHGRTRTRGLFLMAPHVSCEDCSVAAIERSQRAYEDTDLREKLARHHAHVDVAFSGWSRAWLDPAFRDWTIAPYLPRIRAPTMVVQCEDDAYGTLRQVDAIEAGSGGPVQRLVLPTGGHAPHKHRPEAVLDALDAFVGCQR